MTECTGLEALRAALLEHLDGDVLPMAHLDTVIAKRWAATTAAERRAIAMELIGALLAEKVILVGDVVGGDPAFIEPWSGSDQVIIDRIEALYVDQYDEPDTWSFRIWFALNDVSVLASHL